MVHVAVHGLRDADVGADGGAEEVQDPEGGDDAEVEFAGRGLVGDGNGGRGMGGDIPVDSLDFVNVILELLGRGGLLACL